MKNKLFIFFIIFLFGNVSFGIDLSEVTEPKPMIGRIEIDNKIDATKKESQKTKKISSKLQNEPQKKEEKYEEDAATKKITYENKSTQNYADLSLRNLANDISYELELDSAKTTADLSVLWTAATARSETMQYTIYKLSNPDEDKPSESTLKKILKPIASFSSMAGASVAGDPYMATGALIGGGLINAMMSDDKEANYKFSKVSDADMILLVRKIDDLQKKLIDLYVDYKTKEQLAKMTKENFVKREKIYQNSQDKSKEELVIADVYYRNAKVSAQRAQDEFLTSRAILENLVGTDALAKIEED